jgi:hypothetical protein
LLLLLCRSCYWCRLMGSVGWTLPDPNSVVPKFMAIPFSGDLKKLILSKRTEQIESQK